MAAPIYVGGIALPADDSIEIDPFDDGHLVVDRSGPIWQTLDDLKRLLPAVLRSGDSNLRDAWLQAWGTGFLNAQARAGFTLEAQWSPRFAEELWLDAWGDLLGKPRANGENDQDYRARLLTGIDMVSPVAIKAAVNAILTNIHSPPVIYNEPAVDKAYIGPATTSDPVIINSRQQTIVTLQTWVAFTQPQVPLSGSPTPNQSVYYAKNLRFWANYAGVTGNSPIGAFSTPLGSGFWIIAQSDIGEDALTPYSEPIAFSINGVFSTAFNQTGFNPSDFTTGITGLSTPNQTAVLGTPTNTSLAYGYTATAYAFVVDQINVEVSRRKAAGVPWVFMVDLPSSNAIGDAAVSPEPAYVATPAPNSATASGGADVVYHRPFYLPSDVAATVIRIGNRGPVLGGRGNSVTCNVALYKSDGAGVATGSPLGLWNSVTIPGDGTDWTSPPTIVERGSDGRVVLLYSLPALTNCDVSAQVNYGSYSNATLVVSPPPAITATDPNPPFWVHFEYNTAKRRLAIFGDSISTGCVSVTGFEITPWYKLGTIKDYSASMVSLPGGSLADWANFAGNPALWDSALLYNVEGVWIQLGVNDLNSGAVTMKTNLTTIVNRLKNTYGVNRIWANTIAPQISYPGTETDRLTYNSDLLGAFGVSLGLAGVADFAKIQSQGGLADNSNPAVLHAAFSADGTHWTDAGYAQALPLVHGLIG